jgi:hypothetical protein
LPWVTLFSSFLRLAGNNGNGQQQAADELTLTEQHKRNKASMVSKSAAEHFVVLTGQQAPDSIEERRAG